MYGPGLTRPSSSTPCSWHWNVPVSQLTRRNVAHLLTYGFYYRSRAEMEAEGMGDEPDRMVRELEEAWGVRFADDSGDDAANRSSGGGKELPIMAHLWEPVRCFYRPLAFYAGVEVLMALKHTVLLAIGFRAHMHKGARGGGVGCVRGQRGGIGAGRVRMVDGNASRTTWINDRWSQRRAGMDLGWDGATG